MVSKDEPNTNQALDKSQLKAVKNTFDLYTAEKFPEASNKSYESKSNISKREQPEEAIKVLKPKLQNSIKEIQSKVDMDKVQSLLDASKSKDLDLFKSDDPTMTDEHQKNIMKKLSKWESTTEINTANAAVVTS